MNRVTMTSQVPQDLCRSCNYGAISTCTCLTCVASQSNWLPPVNRRRRQRIFPASQRKHLHTMSTDRMPLVSMATARRSIPVAQRTLERLKGNRDLMTPIYATNTYTGTDFNSQLIENSNSQSVDFTNYRPLEVKRSRYQDFDYVTRNQPVQSEPNNTSISMTSSASSPFDCSCGAPLCQSKLFRDAYNLTLDRKSVV